MNNDIFLLSCLAMESKTLISFSWQGRKVQSYSTHLRPKSPRKIIRRVLEKYVRLVGVTCTSPKVGLAASKLVPRKEKWGPRGLKEFPKQLITLSYYWLVLLV